MGLSVGALNSNTYSVRPMAYALQNKSSVSSAYTESVAQASGSNGVTSVKPVSYPNAQVVQESGAASATASAQAVNASFNAIASAYEGATTGYGANSAGYGYDMIGSKFDAFA